MSPAGRRPGKSTTAEDILVAARAAFADHGFQGATIRSIADAAGVNQALVRHYYGSKEQLFAAALAFPPEPVQALFAAVQVAPPEQLGERLATVFVGAWRSPSTGPQLRAFFRSAATTERGAASARQLIEQVLVPTLTSALDVSPTDLGAAAGLLLGFAFLSEILEAAPLAGLDDDDAIALLGPVLETVLRGPGTRLP